MAATEVDDEPFLETGEHVPGSPGAQAEDEGGVHGDVEAVPDRIFLKDMVQGSMRRRGAPRRRIDSVVPAA
ncbi:hypothetical protein [Streptomyces sp. NPDC101776]|uniref:hypothetical protein n=1 Tax=Streptomyces sp. NPDC101776 TaxID=3366146 RepID=UPI0038046492